MEIKPPATSPTTLITESGSSQNNPALNRANISHWQLGQIIQALVVKIENDQLFLNIQGQLAVAPRPAQLPVASGDQLQLEVLQREPQPLFRILNKAIQPPLQTLIDQQLRAIIAKQQPLAPLFKHINQLVQQQTAPAQAQPPRLPVMVQTQLRDFFQQLPGVLQLKTAAQLQTHLRNTGVFLEQRLSQPHANKFAIQKDLRASLLRLASTIRSQLPPTTESKPADTSLPPLTPRVESTLTNNALPPAIPAQAKPVTPEVIPAPAANKPSSPSTATATSNPTSESTLADDTLQTLLQQVESSVARIQQQQLQSLSHENQQGRALWLMELPIRDGQEIDVFQLRIEEEANKNSTGAAQKIWSVTLNFDLAGLGLVSAYVQLQGEQLSISFRTQEPHTQQLFQQHINQLRERLNLNGLSVTKLDCLQQKVADLFQPQRKLLDEQA